MLDRKQLIKEIIDTTPIEGIRGLLVEIYLDLGRIITAQCEVNERVKKLENKLNN